MLIEDVNNLRTLLYRLCHRDSRGKTGAVWGKNVLYKIWREKSVPLPVIFLLSRLVAESSHVNGLFVKDDFKTKRGMEIENLKLSQMLMHQVLGDWRLDVETINYLEKDIKKIRPRTVLECGSGISTICLAQFLIETQGKAPLIRVYSVEQDEKYAKQSQRLVTEQGLEKYVKIICVPLTNRIVEGVNCYTYNPEILDKNLNGVEVDYCIIDGPSVVEFDGRFATLPMLKKYISKPHARFVLDDALRAKELLIAKKWKQLPYINIQGIALTRKGLLTGFFRS